jgi:hypothetical protein
MTPCVNWIGAVQGNGYGYMYGNNRKLYAHRKAYEIVNGPIPSGAVIHHRCGNKLCINTDHMELIKDENSHGALHSGFDSVLSERKNHCGRGHEFTEENTYIKHTKRGKWRECRECRKLHMSAYRRRAEG